MRTDRPLTLTVEQAGHLLGVGRSTAYELVRTGELECVRLRRRLLVPTVRVAELLGLTLADVWGALEARTELGVGSSDSPASAALSRAHRVPGPPSLF